MRCSHELFFNRVISLAAVRHVLRWIRDRTNQVEAMRATTLMYALLAFVTLLVIIGPEVIRWLQ
jgi:hypothetical protein